MSLGSIRGQMALAQQCAAKQAIDRDDYATVDAPRDIIMGAVSRAVEMQGSRISEVLITVSLFLDRFFGPQPEDCATPGVATPQPSGIVHEVERNLSHNDYLLGELEQKVRRLGDIA